MADRVNFNNLASLTRGGVDPNLVHPDTGDTPIFPILLKKSDRCLKIVCRRNADPNYINRVNGYTPLTYICRMQGYGNMIDLLVTEYGANPNLQDGNGDLPLTICARYGRRPEVDLLLRKGADPNILDRDGKSALWYALRDEFDPIVDMLVGITTVEVVEPPRHHIRVRTPPPPRPPDIEVPQPRQRVQIRRPVQDEEPRVMLRQPPPEEPRAIIVGELRWRCRTTCQESSDHLAFSIKKYVSPVIIDGAIHHYKIENGTVFKKSDFSDTRWLVEKINGKYYLVVKWHDEIAFNEYEFLHPKLKYKDSLPDHFKCMVCLEPFHIPCMNSCGEVYCRDCLQSMLEKNISKDPRTRNPMKLDVCIESDFIRRAMSEWLCE